MILKWKTSQYRIFALYVGFVVLKDKNLFSSSIYKHFLLFSISMRLLHSDGNQENIELITDMLIKFNQIGGEVYGKTFLSYNVHSLIHCVEDYKKYGNLSNVSAFSFESYLGVHVKGAIRCGNKPFHQVGSHISRLNSDVKNSIPQSHHI